jgi:hypothetical protein
MGRVARLSVGERSDLFSETATQKSTAPSAEEKVFLVTWMFK